MSSTNVTKSGQKGTRPDREALTGVVAGRAPDELPTASPETEYSSYYGMPVLNSPVWKDPDIPGYLFLGGLAGATALLASGSDLTGRPQLARVCKLAAFGSSALSVTALVHDLGRPARFLNMLRVFKVTSPMSVGSWLLAGFVPLAGVAAASDVTGKAPRLGSAAAGGAAALGPVVATYTAALLTDTAVPAWHDGYREMPYVFAGSAATAAGGFGMLTAPTGQVGPGRAMATAGVVAELSSAQLMLRRLGMVAEPYHSGRAGRFVRAGEALSVAGLAGALLGRRSRIATALSGAALLAASAATRWGVFHAGKASAADPKYTVVPQRQRLSSTG